MVCGWLCGRVEVAAAAAEEEGEQLSGGCPGSTSLGVIFIIPRVKIHPRLIEVRKEGRGESVQHGGRASRVGHCCCGSLCEFTVKFRCHRATLKTENWFVWATRCGVYKTKSRKRGRVMLMGRHARIEVRVRWWRWSRSGTNK